jgi:hypothetical protein
LPDSKKAQIMAKFESFTDDLHKVENLLTDMMFNANQFCSQNSE